MVCCSLPNRANLGHHSQEGMSEKETVLSLWMEILDSNPDSDFANHVTSQHFMPSLINCRVSTPLRE